MIPHHVYYLRTAMGCLGLCIMLHTIWSSRGAVSPQLLAAPVPPQSDLPPTIFADPSEN